MSPLLSPVSHAYPHPFPSDGGWLHFCPHRQHSSAVRAGTAAHLVLTVRAYACPGLRPNGPSSRASSVATARRTPTPAPPVMTTVAGRGRGKRAAAAAAADHLQPEAARRAAKRARPSLRRAEGDDEDEGDDDGDDDDDDDFSVFEETERPRAAPSAASSPGSTLLRVESTQAEGVGGGASPGEQAKGHESVETERLELLRRLAALPPMPGVEALWGHFAGMAGSFADMINHD